MSRHSLLGDDIQLISGQHIESAELTFEKRGIPYLTGPTDFLNGKPNAERFTGTGRAFCQAGDILVVVKGSGTGAVVRADRRYAIGRQLMAVRPKSWDANFVHQVLLANGQRYEAVASGLIPGISRDVILDTSFVALPSREQKRVAEILATWDRAIEKLRATVTAKTERLRALRQQLLTGTRRFPEFKKARWRTVQLAAVAENVSERNDTQFTSDRLYAVTKAEGMVPMRERVKGVSHVRCKIVAQDSFAYNPMRLNIGSIARWQQKAPVMVSGDYVVFRCKEAELLPDYLDHVRRSGLWSSFVKAAGNGSVRVRIYFNDLGRLSFPLPSLEGQQRIAAVLSACANEIRLLGTELAALKLQKRGLMQKLLTGEVRVKP